MEKNEKKYQVDNIANYINNLGKEIGLPDLGFNKDNVCTLEFYKKITVHIIFKKEKNNCTFASPLCSITNNDLEKFF